MKRLAIALIIVLLAVACGQNSSEKKSETAAPAPAMKTVTKGFVDQLKQEYKGKILIVNFFASWCPPCRGETPDFVKAYEKYKDKNFVIVGLSVDKNLADAEKYVKDFGVPYPVYRADNDLGNEFNIQTIPTSMIYKPDGKLFDIVVGPLTPKELDIIANGFKK